MRVLKRGGATEPHEVEKIHKVLEWACEGITGVSVSDIEMAANIQFYDLIPTETIHDILIAAAEDLISEDTPNYQYVAARLALFQLRKKVLGGYNPIHLLDLVRKNVELGLYDPQLESYYTESEWDLLNSFINHKRDDKLTIASVKQLKDKYLVQDRSTKTVYETPQYAFMLIAAVLFKNYDKKYNSNTRLKYVKEFYDALSKFDISLPTPIMAGVRTLIKQFSSCVLVDMGDSLESITAAGNAITRYGAKRAGLGINGGRLRAVGSKIRNGEVVSTGVVPYFRKLQGDLKCVSQGGIRDASATIYVPFWHFEIESILPLKNNKGTADNRVRLMDYGIQMDTYLVKRAVQKKDMTLFSPHEVPDLYDAFFSSDRTKFETLYEKYEKDPSIKMKKVVNARELLLFLLTERQETARIYTFMADHVNTHSTFKQPIYMSNLCAEITLPTAPIENIINEYEGTVEQNGWVQLCTLAAVNLGTCRHPDDIESRMNLLVRGLNEILDYQDYPVKQAREATQLFRPLGIGVINYAYFLAKNGVSYNDQGAWDLTHQFAEAMAYFALKSTVQLAKDNGAIAGLEHTKYADGTLIIDTYKQAVDEITANTLRYDWESLREEVKKYGVYNSTLLALMPSESSSVVSNATSGVEPVRALVADKGNKKISFKQVVPEIGKLKNQYDMLWEMTPTHFEGYIKCMAVWQKFVCQSISTNTSYNPEHFPEGKISMDTLLKHFLLTVKYGIKTLYYQNVMGDNGEGGKKEEQQDEAETGDDGDGGCADGACKI